MWNNVENLQSQNHLNLKLWNWNKVESLEYLFLFYLSLDPKDITLSPCWREFKNFIAEKNQTPILSLFQEIWLFRQQSHSEENIQKFCISNEKVIFFWISHKWVDKAFRNKFIEIHKVGAFDYEFCSDLEKELFRWLDRAYVKFRKKYKWKLFFF